MDSASEKESKEKTWKEKRHLCKHLFPFSSLSHPNFLSSSLLNPNCDKGNISFHKTLSARLSPSMQVCLLSFKESLKVKRSTVKFVIVIYKRTFLRFAWTLEFRHLHDCIIVFITSPGHGERKRNNKKLLWAKDLPQLCKQCELSSSWGRFVTRWQLAPRKDQVPQLCRHLIMTAKAAKWRQ